MAKYSFWEVAEENALDEMESRIEAAKTRLKPVKNLHFVNPCVCAFCKHFMMANGFAACERENGFLADAGDMLHYQMTCEYFTRQQEE